MNITLPRAVIQQALEALEYMDVTAEHYVDNRIPESAITALRTALEQPEQEPVGWLYPEGLAALKAGRCWTAYGTKQDDDNNIPIYDGIKE